MYRSSFDSPDTMPFALGCMVAYQAADHGQRVVVEQHLGGGHQVVFLEQPDHFRNIGMDGTAFPAHGFLALETPVGFFQFVNGHTENLVSSKMVFPYSLSNRQGFCQGAVAWATVP